MPLIHGFDPPERFVTGTVGEPGQRTFFLQARSGARITSVSVEKQQVAALSERIDFNNFTFSSRIGSASRTTGGSIATRARTCKRWFCTMSRIAPASS